MPQVKLIATREGNYLLESLTREGRYGNVDMLFQTDFDFPVLAADFGFRPCENCNQTDGTVDCEHRTASEMIQAAISFLDEHEGEIIEEPSYFTQNAY